ncbi:agarase [Saccharobesus litoralis]|uniref:Agarase n=1 Tax=Saccharobesus litoralis TaxID=2172099 RepID=A0A2S0VP65_9ALTE|nr:beta-galactosidase [Saccharobesus litoralis]AWB66006.1 agarase [Saccharobesus litoralis]
MKKNIKLLTLSLLLSMTVGTALLLSACQQNGNPTDENKHKVKSLPDELILGFEQSVIPAAIKLKNAKGQLVTEASAVSQGQQALRVKFDAKNKEHTSIVIEPKTPFDWSHMQDFSLAFDIANQGETSVHLMLGVTDIKGRSYTRAVNIPVGPSKTYYSKMHGHDVGSPNNKKGDKVELNLSSGLRSNPATWQSDDTQFVWMWGTKNLELSGIKRISLSTSYNLRDKEITLDNIRLMPHPEMDKNYLVNIVDKYGQSAKMEYPEKVHSDEELAAKTQAELKRLQNGKMLADRSKYSGWKQGPKLTGTGYFRTEKVDGKWWLVDPEGYLYVATGVDIIRLSNASTMTGYDFTKRSDKSTRKVVSDTRANMFEWLPESYDHPLADHFGYRGGAHSGALKRGEVFSFYSANLERKYGETSPQSYLRSWRNVTIDRMRHWGFTSLGNWTHPMYYDNTKIPYFAHTSINGKYKTVSSGNDFWAPMPDVFDPEFARIADKKLAQVANQVKGSEWCVGVFVDNEKSWGRSNSRSTELGIVIHTLKRNGKQVPTKAKFTQVMRDKYKDIKSLNQAWNTNIASWAAFDKGGFNSQLQKRNKVQDADYAQLLAVYADQYFKIVSTAMKKHMPNHLYFGARFASWGMPMEVVNASAPYTDVVSFNNYKPGITQPTWAFLEELDKPTMIGEFHFGTSSSGFFHPGLIHAADQKDRAMMYKDYMRSVFNNNYFVGAHWFQYHDSPITGRAYDGENYNVGFVTVADEPYEEMVKAAKELHGEMYSQRFNRAK